jgi:hypothetical protein
MVWRVEEEIGSLRRGRIGGKDDVPHRGRHRWMPSGAHPTPSTTAARHGRNAVAQCLVQFSALFERETRARSSADRAGGFGPSGRGFDSCRARHFHIGFGFRAAVREGTL